MKQVSICRYIDIWICRYMDTDTDLSLTEGTVSKEKGYLRHLSEPRGALGSIGEPQPAPTPDWSKYTIPQGLHACK